MPPKREIPITHEELISLYTNQHLPMRVIAKSLGTSDSYVVYLMRKWNIPSRSKSEAIKLGIQEGRVTFRSGENHNGWKGGRYQAKGGYVYLKRAGHRLASISGYVREHVLVWEETNGKQLPEGWVVHHVNGVRNDNRSENLMAMPRNSHHYAFFLQGLRKRIRTLEAEIVRLKAERNLPL